MRIFLFLMTNIGVLAVVSIIGKLLGLDQILAQSGYNWQASLAMCAVYGFVGSLISLFMSKSAAKRSSRTQVITNPQNAQEQWLIDTVARQAKQAGIDMPEVGIFPAQQSNAFATGWNKNKALVAVSQGMLDRFEKDEVEAVMAHEIGHVANGDMVTMTLLQGVVNTFVLFFARIVASAVSKGDRRGMGYFAVYMIAQVALGFLASAITMWFSRYREFRADEAGAKFGTQQGMIRALERLQREQGVPNQMPDTLMAFGINKGKLKAKFGNVFSSHPPLDKRINALRQIDTMKG